MASRLSDEELRKSLREYGEDVGPITPTTRSAWERRLISLRKSKAYTPKKVFANALSSDDSEIDNNLSPSTRRSKRTSFPRQNYEASPERSASRPARSSASSFDADDIFKKPTALNSSLSTLGKKMLHTNHLKNQIFFAGKLRKSAETYDVNTSDSDFDSDNSFTPKNSHRARRKPNRSSKTILNSSLNNNSTWNSNSETRLNHCSSSSDMFMTDHTKRSYQGNGYISNSLSNGELNEEREGESTNYSHCISWLLLFGTATFFIIIGAVYISELQKTSHMSSKSNSKFCDRVSEEMCENLIVLSKELHHLLAIVAGVYDCVADRKELNRSLTIPVARSAMESFFNRDDRFKGDNFDFLFNESVILLTKNSEMGVKFYSGADLVDPSLPGALEAAQGSKSLMDPSLSGALEAAQGSKSLGCRIRLSLEWTLTKIVLLCGVGFIVFLCLVLMKFWKKRREAQEKIFFEMVERVIDILQETSDWSVDNEPFKPVVRVRDAIIPPKERKEKLWLWDRVVAFIEENESRVSVEFHTINGEDYKVWKWQPTTEQNEGGKSGKVWQGQAFSSLGKGKNTMYSLSPCLKIRNMFDSEMEYEDGWEVSIQDAILEKCEGNDGIRHIAVDTSNNEACVYMLCSSTETAGKAFNDLHGWWFDGKLVTVKYIPYKRYLERFPTSEECTEPLRPSNNKRLSLSTPFFSSALERS